MRNINIKFLTLILGALLAANAFASILQQEKNQTHLRLNIFTDRNFLNVEKRGERILLRSLNQQVLDEIIADIEATPLDKAYIKSHRLINDGEGKVPTLELQLAGPRVELFSFYRDREKRHVLDFWMNQKELKEKRQIVMTEAPKPSVTPRPKKVENPKVKNDEVRLVESRTAPTNEVLENREPSPKQEGPSAYRDFRYGASFVWDYAPIAPRIEDPIILERKTAEYFYPIKDRDIELSEEEAHLQLSINLFRDGKWGLMAKSVQLFEQKFPRSKLAIHNEYLKANTLLRENFERGNSRPVKSAITMYENIAQSSDDYELRKGINKYLLTYYSGLNENLRTLQLAKRFYIDSRENFDHEESTYAVRMILSSLARLGRIDEIRDVTRDETIRKIVPRQLIMAYETYALLKTDKVEDVIRLYEDNERGLSRPVEGTILYNVAEAYFRRANYEKAIALYDTFVAENSFRTASSNARLRIALCYDLLERDYDQTMQLYLNAINRSQDHEVSYEARIRYTAMRSIRPRVINDSDRERRIFLERDRRLGGEIKQELRELLWITRLRTFIVDEKFQDALSYLNAIPLTSMTPAKRRAFEGDGAEIIYGLMKESFRAGEYAKVLQMWELYRDQYVARVAEDPFINYLVGNSYLKLGLYQGFDQLYMRFSRLESSPQRSFPLWIERPNLGGPQELLGELQVIRNIALENWSAALTELERIDRIVPSRNKNNFYRGLISYRQGQLREAIRHFEKYLAAERGPRSFDPVEVADLLLGFSDSLYQLGEHERFRRVAEAFLSDTRAFARQHKYLKEVKEKVAYLLIENYARDNTDQAFLTIEPMIKEFNIEFPESNYQGRLNLLLGMSYVRNKNRDAGKELFEQLVEDQTISDVVRELARSELSLLRIEDISL